MTKFSSVNLNESYGKPEQAGSTSGSANSSTSSKPRPVTQGGMLVLTRPGRGQPTGVKPGRLGIPSPVNLPSLKRENSGDTHVALSTSPSLPGWTKGGQGESLTPLSGNVNGEITEKPGAGRSIVVSGGARVGLLDNMTEDQKGVLTPAAGKSDVYTPPRLRAMQASGGLSPHIPPPSPAEKAAIIRGEEFPTLQASLARPPTPPQQQRQKEVQQKHREKQLEVKEQQLKLQQLSHQQQTNADKQSFGDTSQAPTDGLLLQPAQPKRLTIKQEQPETKDVALASINQSFGQGIRDGDGSLSRPPPLVRLKHVSNWADDERERGLDNRTQAGSPSVQVSQGSPSIHTQQTSHSNEVDVSWTSMRRSNMSSRNGDMTRNSRDFRTSSDDDLGGRDGSELRGSSFEREDSLRRFDSGSKDGISTGYGGGEGYHQQDFGKEGSGPGSFGRVIGPVHETVQGREGYYARGLFGRDSHYRDAREPYNREFREPYNKDSREPYNRDARELYNQDSREPYNRDARESCNRDSREPYNREAREPYIRDSRDPYSRDSRESVKRNVKEMYNRDAREAHYRDARDTYTKDIKEVYNQDVNMSAPIGYGNLNNDGGNMYRGEIGNNGSPRGRVNYFAGGGAAFHNPGFGHDARHSRRYGFHSTGGDHPFLKETRPGLDSRIARGRYMEPPVAHDGLGGRRNRVPVLGSSHDNVREFYEVGLERTLNSPEERQKFEAKGTEVKVTTEEERLDYLDVKSSWKDDKSEEPAARGDAGRSKKLQDERKSREDEKMPGFSEEERRKEAARRKLLELEERIAQRKAEERRKEEVETKAKVEDKKFDDAQQMNAHPSFKEAREEAMVNLEFKDEDKGIVFERNNGVGWKEEDPHSKLTRPSSGSSSSSWTFRVAGEELSREQDFGPGAVETKSSQEHKVLRSKSPVSWRKDASFNGNAPISKLFSSPYIESGSLHRPTDGGNYKLF